MKAYEGKLLAPDFPAGLDWLNTDRPLRLVDLRGKVVLLDFWSYCSIDCVQVLPDLKKLQRKYARELVVVGVHSGRYTAQGQTESIRKAVLRYEIDHPVINDADLQVWGQYDVSVAPTVVLLDPLGKVVWSMAGVAIFEPIDELIPQVIETFEQKHRLDRTPVSLPLETLSAGASELAFPGAVLADPVQGRLFIADSNHNRIIMLALDDYRLLAVIGSGIAGLDDGAFGSCEFHNPQGMALSEGMLYVADAGNHAVRAVNLEMGMVTTVAGTGRRAQRSVPGAGRTSPLDSPWGLAAVGEWLYIAMAGAHRIWRLHLRTNHLEPFAGTGQKGRQDGPCDQAAFAQPCGLASDGNRLYVADSEVSSVRAIDLAERQVTTIVGGGEQEYGDQDGQGPSARLQHPQAIAWHEGRLYVADTYNHKIKVIDLASGVCRSLLGTGQPGSDDGAEPGFYEPAGLAVAEDRLFIADTNNHLIRVADLNDLNVLTLPVPELEATTTREEEEEVEERVRELPPQTVQPGPVTLSIVLDLPAALAVKVDSPSSLHLSSSDGSILSSGLADRTIAQPQFPLLTVLEVPAGRSELLIDLALYYCRTDKRRLAYFKRNRIKLPIHGDPTSAHTQLRVRHRPPYLT